MYEAAFLVQGSASEPYNVVFRKDGVNFTARCSCPAGDVGQCCKHRLKIIVGDPDGIVSGNLSDVSAVQNWIAGTDVEQALRDLQDAERKLEEAKQLVSTKKKQLAKCLID